MNVRHIILGFLKTEPMTGYEIKKKMQRSPLIYWSGNNNQIYRVLSDLSSEGCVECTVLHQETAPTKKEYCLTQLGEEELRRLSLQFPEAPELRKPFLLQLLFSEGVSKSQLKGLLEQYSAQVEGNLAMLDASCLPIGKTTFERELSALVLENAIQFFRAELAWIEKVKKSILPLTEERKENVREEGAFMQVIAIQKDELRYAKLESGQLTAEADALTLIGDCAAHNTNLLLVPEKALSDTFKNLSSKAAGLMMQKLVNYNIKTAFVVDIEQLSLRFQQFASETNRGKLFCFVKTVDEAERWFRQTR